MTIYILRDYRKKESLGEKHSEKYGLVKIGGKSWYIYCFFPEYLLCTVTLKTK
jgi:hypothetical protein